MNDKPSRKFVWEEGDLIFSDDDKVSKENPNHDEQGRFSEGPGGGAGGAGEFKEGTATWTKPAEADLRREYKVEYINHFKPAYGDIFPTEDSFVAAVKAAPVVTVDRKLDGQISGRSRVRSMEGLLDLISGYRSYPKYRNEGTLAALAERIKTGKPTDLPIVTNDNGHMRVLSGNTRMDIGFMHNATVKAIMLDVSRRNA